MFPLSIGPISVEIGGREDIPNPNQLLCLCPRPPIPAPVPGIPVGFWEPVRLVDVTRTPYCMVTLGGIKLGSGTLNHGGNAKNYALLKRAGGLKHSYYHVHWTIYPITYWLEVLIDFACLESLNIDLAYLTELDPMWGDDELSFILNPEAILFGNPMAQSACAADCLAASSGFPQNALFWCGGCQGSLYPFNGTVSAHVGGVQASLLITERFIAKLHRELLLWGTSGADGLCTKYPAPIIKKDQYKTQMVYPIPATGGPLACNPLGRTEVVHGSGKEFPMKGEDFGYLIWRKRNCCVS